MRREPPPQRPLLITLALLTTVTAIVSSLGAPLVPAIAARYDVSIAAAQWSLTAALLAGAVITPVLGRLGTGRWRRRAVLLTTACVLAGTLLSTVPALGALLVGRALQGAGMALVPLALAIARDHTRGAQMAQWLGLLSVSTVAGAGFGYPLTALVADHAGIAGAYAFGSVLVAATLAMAWRFLPGSTDSTRQPLDVGGAALLTVGMLGVLLAVSQGEQWGWAASRTLALGIGGICVLTAWVSWSLRHPQPLVDLRLAGHPGVATPNAVTFLLGLAMYAILTLVVLVAQADGSAGYGLDASVTTTGLLLVPYALLSVTSNQAARRVAQRFGPRVVLPVGCLAFSIALCGFAAWHQHLWQVFLVMALAGFGSGFTFASVAALIVPHVPRAETSSALAFNQLLRYLGFTVGSAISVALLDLLGGDDAALTTALALMAGLCLLAGVVSLLDRRERT